MKKVDAIGLTFFGAISLFANPSNGNVVSGQAEIQNPTSQSCLIKASDRTIIEWDSFSIQKGEITQFIQPTSESTVLNRVSGQDPSSILGTLEANGSVYLINENGIVFGVDCLIDVGAFTASTLNILDHSFLKENEHLFSGDSRASIIHLGEIHARTGSVAILAHRIETEGTIHAPGGTVAFGSGHEILLQPKGSRLLYISRGGGDGIDMNGSLAALKTEIEAGVSPYSLGIRLSGTVDALNVARENGEVYLSVSDGPLWISENASIKANQIEVTAVDGPLTNRGTLLSSKGKISIQSVCSDEKFENHPPIVNGGLLDDPGGGISISGTKFLNYGTISANEGSIKIESALSFIGTQRSSIQARSGTIDLSAGTSFFSSGSIEAEGGRIAISSDLARFAGSAVLAKNGSVEVAALTPVEINEFSSFKGRHIRFHANELEKSYTESFTLSSLPPLGTANVQSCICPIYEFVDPHSTGSPSNFGLHVYALPVGNVVIPKDDDNFGASNSGSVFLYDGSTQALISFLYGSNTNDLVGENLIEILTNGNYVVSSPEWRNPVTMFNQAGAATWRSATGTVTEAVSTTNSIHGTAFGDRVSVSGVDALTNGNAIVSSGTWNGGRGAATLMNGTDGTDAGGVFGPVSVGNSITGSPGHGVASQGVLPSKNGNGVIITVSWNGSRGAATWINGSTGKDGTGGFNVVSAANSIVGSAPNDQVGSNPIALEDPINGNFIIGSSAWTNFTGASTWMNGTNGQSATGYGAVTALNSVIGSAPMEFPSVWALANGHALMITPLWNGGLGAITWIDGTNGQSVTGYGVVTALNSITGANPGDQVGLGGVGVLSTGNAIVGSSNWNSGRGAVTWINGADGKDINNMRGNVTTSNSVTGASAGDLVGNSVFALTNDNVIAACPGYGGGLGAAVWINGTNGTDIFNTYGTVTAANTVTGSLPTDFVGAGVPLLNGNFVLVTPQWGDNAGAVTWLNGENGTTALGQYGAVSSANSLVGTVTGAMGDQVGTLVSPLANGNYVVTSLLWENSTGAVTLGNGTDGSYCGAFGPIDSRNSILGPAPNSNLRFLYYPQSIIDDTANQSFLFAFGDYLGESRVFTTSSFGCYIPSPSTSFISRGEHKYLIAISEAFVKCLYNSLGGYLEQDDFPPADTNKEMNIRIPSLVSKNPPDLPKIEPNPNSRTNNSL